MQLMIINQWLNQCFLFLRETCHWINEMGVHAEYEFDYLHDNAEMQNTVPILQGQWGTIAGLLLLSSVTVPKDPPSLGVMAYAIVTLPTVMAEHTFFHHYQSVKIQQMIPTGHNGEWLAAAPVAGDNVQATMPALLLLNSLGQPLSFHSYEFTDSAAISGWNVGLVAYPGSEVILFVNMQWSGMPVEALVMRLRYPDNIIWSNSFSSKRLNTRSIRSNQPVTITDNGDILLAMQDEEEPFLQVIMRLNSQGERVWLRSFGLPGLQRDLVAHSVAVLSNGQIVLAGGGVAQVAWVASVDAEGSLLWSQTIGDTQLQSIQLHTIAQIQADSFAVAGRFTSGDSNHFVARYSLDGGLLATQSFRNTLGSRTTDAFLTARNNRYYFASGTAQVNNQGYFLVQFNNQLEFVSESFLLASSADDLSLHISHWQADDQGLSLAYSAQARSDSFVYRHAWNGDEEVDCLYQEDNIAFTHDLLGGRVGVTLAIEAHNVSAEVTSRAPQVVSRQVSNDYRLICNTTTRSTPENSNGNDSTGRPTEESSSLSSANAALIASMAVVALILLSGLTAGGVWMRRRCVRRGRQRSEFALNSLPILISKADVVLKTPLRHAPMHVTLLVDFNDRRMVMRQYKSETIRVEVMQELRMLQSLKNRHCLSLQAAMLDDQLVVLADYQPLGELATWLLTRPMLAMPEVLALSEEMVTGLAFLHRNNVIHGKLHARNVVRVGERQLALTDFGLSELESLACSRQQDIYQVGILMNALLVMLSSQPGSSSKACLVPFIELIARCQCQQPTERPMGENVKLELSRLRGASQVTSASVDDHSDVGMVLQSQHCLFSNNAQTIEFLSNFATQAEHYNFSRGI